MRRGLATDRITADGVVSKMISFFTRSSSKATNDDDVNAVDKNMKTEEALLSPYQTMSSQPSMSASPLPSEPSSNIKPEESNNRPGDFITWTSSHDAYCRKHGVLRANVTQVLHDIGKEEEDAPWPLPSQSSVMLSASDVATALRMLDQEQPSRQPDTGSTSTLKTASTPGRSTLSLLASPFSWTKKMVRSMIRDEEGYSDEDEWVQDGDEAFDEDEEYFAEGDNEIVTPATFGTSSPIINFTMTRSAIHLLEQEINSNHTLSFQGETPIVLGVSEWNSWTTEVLSKGTARSLSEIPVSDRQLLLKILLELKVANFIRRKAKTSSADLIVLYPSGMVPTQNKEKRDEIPEKLRVPIALWDLHSAEQLIERQIGDWAKKVDECNSQALKLKRENKISAAKHFLRKRNRIQQEIEMATQRVVKIEQAKSAIECSQSNKMVMEVLADTTKLLKDQRKQTCIDDVDDVMVDFQQELDDQKELHDALTASNETAMGGPIDDDELLRELEGLTLDNLTNDPAQSEIAATSDDVPLELPELSVLDDQPQSSLEKPGSSASKEITGGELEKRLETVS